MRSSSGQPIALVALVALLGAGCSGAPEKKQVAPPEPELKPCGSETIQRGDGYDAAARECLWQSYKARELAQFTTTRFTIEGDPVSYRVEVRPPDVVVVVDSKDRYGLKGVFRHTCRAFERIAQEDRPDRFGFALSGCTGGGADRLAVP